MKKCIGLILFGLLIVAFSAPVYAQLEFKASGMVDTNWMYYRNITNLNGNPDSSAKGVQQIFGGPVVTDALAPNGGGFNKQTNWFNTRGLLKFDAAMGKDVSGTIYFEMDATRWGERQTGRNFAGLWQTDAAAVEVKNIYLDFGMPYFGIPVPMTVRVGLQPLAIRRELVTSNDGAGITLGFKADPVTISPFYFKMLHNAPDFAYSGDNDVYGIQGTAAIGKLTLGAYGVLYNMRTYPLSATTSPIMSGYGANPDSTARFYWFGGYADGGVGPVNIKADFVYDYGKVKPWGAFPTARDVKYSGYVARLGIKLPVEMFEFGVQGLYASGADARKTSMSGLPGTTVGNGSSAYTAQSTKVGSYVIPPGSEEPPAFGENGILVFYQGNQLGRQPDFGAQRSANTVTKGAIGGTWFAQARASYKAAPWYKITLMGMYIGDTTKNGNTVGSARKADGTLRDDKGIGWEVGLYNEFQIYKNLSFNVAGGWLFAKNGLDQWSGTRNVSPKDPYLLGTCLKYTW